MRTVGLMSAFATTDDVLTAIACGEFGLDSGRRCRLSGPLNSRDQECREVHSN
jgi:hypothetical protein